MLLLITLLLVADYIVKRSLSEYHWTHKYFVLMEEDSLAFLLRKEEV